MANHFARSPQRLGRPVGGRAGFLPTAERFAAALFFPSPFALGRAAASVPTRTGCVRTGPGALRAGAWRRGRLLVGLLSVLACWSVAARSGLVAAELPEHFRLPAPPGPYVGPEPPEAARDTFRSGRPLVVTTYFYWYDVTTGAHVVDPDGTDALTHHPPTLKGFTYRNPDWHRQQLEDMLRAGIDVLLPVYWGTPLEHGSWSNRGLPPLVEACERLRRQGRRPPRIGLFYDTSTLRHNRNHYHVDLRTPAGRLWFYGTVRDFFSLLPPEHRARIDGRPLVFLYASAFARGVDERLFPELRRLFRRDFGTDLFLVKMRGWPGQADAEYNWGGALRPQFFDVAALGPGYDHSAVPGRRPLVRDREDGRFYSRAWQRLLAMPVDVRPWLVHVETWNEFHEGTEICRSREYGSQYIELTRRFTDLFRSGQRVRPDDAVELPDRLWVTPEQAHGVRLQPQPEGDGAVETVQRLGRTAWQTRPTARSPKNRYLYFDVDDRYWVDSSQPLFVTVDFFDSGPAEFWCEYDSADPTQRGLRQQFRFVRRQRLTQTGRWRTARFVLSRPLFFNRANGADLRLGCQDADLTVARVVIEKRRPTVEEKR